MFQDYALFPHMSLINNVGFGLRMRGEAKKARDSKSMDLLSLVGLANSAHKKTTRAFWRPKTTGGIGASTRRRSRCTTTG